MQERAAQAWPDIWRDSVGTAMADAIGSWTAVQAPAIDMLRQIMPAALSPASELFKDTTPMAETLKAMTAGMPQLGPIVSANFDQLTAGIDTSMWKAFDQVVDPTEMFRSVAQAATTAGWAATAAAMVSAATEATIEEVDLDLVDPTPDESESSEPIADHPGSAAETWGLARRDRILIAAFATALFTSLIMLGYLKIPEHMVDDAMNGLELLNISALVGKSVYDALGQRPNKA